MSNACRHASLWIALGGALGALARHGVESGIPVLLPQCAGFPWATLGINLSGAFFLGWILAYDETKGLKCIWVRNFAGIGFCGSFTTFSGVNLEMVEMAQSGATALAAVYFTASFVLGIAMAWTGAILGVHK